MAGSVKRKSSRSRKTENSAVSVQDYWEDQAKQHKGSDLATNPDRFYRRLEINSIIDVLDNIKDRDVILDVGCGNGFSTCQIAKKFPDSTVIGIDLSATMIKEANKHALANTEFHVGDVLSLSRNRHLSRNHYSIVLSTRCLINLANWDEQKIGILEMRKMLLPNGRIILVENFKEGLANLNAVRAKYKLPPITERWHNCYLPQDGFVKFLLSQSHNLACEYQINIGNMYYMLSRVVYAKICQDQGIEPDYNHQINEIASQMPTFGEYYACSPNFLVVLRNNMGPAQHGHTI